MEKGSCYEWCISDPSGDCTKIWVEVRQNGTDAMFYQCTDVSTNIHLQSKGQGWIDSEKKFKIQVLDGTFN